MARAAIVRRPRARSRVTYRRAGVDVAGVDRWLAGWRGQISSTHGPEVLADHGAFAGLMRLPQPRLRDPVLVASADGVGTKLAVARQLGAHAGIGIDVVAMNANDVLVYGARPLLFLDYLAVGRLQPRVMNALLRGIVAGCHEAGCALLGGETAEMPGLYAPGAYDLAGFCVGTVERRQVIDGSRVRSGDAVVGLASSGLHANGFSLVRRVLSTRALRRLKRQVLAPTTLYVRPVLRLLAQVPIHAMVHVTGGGLTRRLPKLVAGRRGIAVRVVQGSWRIPPIFDTIQRAGGLMRRDMFGTFNMGIGFALVCRGRDTARVLDAMRRARMPAYHIGTIE